MRIARRLRYRPQAARWLILALALASGLAIAFSAAGPAFDRLLDPLRAGAFTRAASGQVVIVELDAASASAIRRWPWSRSNYADVVDRLRQAGVASVVFDVDFSSPSDRAGDADFARALGRADGLVTLPTFGQQASTRDRRTIDALPIPAFRRHVALASVSIAPGPDGIVRDMPFGTITAGVPRPSLSAFIAARSGAADISFPIDMAIDPGTIPRLSFVDVRDGRFDPGTVRGRTILIGATAIEMGDRYGTPRWGVVPGVVVQAMAAETLSRGIPVRGAVILPMLLAAVLALGIVGARSLAGVSVRVFAAATLLIAVVLIAQHALQTIFPLAGSLVVLMVAGIASAARNILAQFRTLRTSDEATGLPNRRAFLAAAGDGGDTVLAVLQIGNYDQVQAVLGQSATTDALMRVVDRVGLCVDGAVYRIADRLVAFALPGDQPLDDMLSGLRSILLQPIEVGGRRIDVTTAIGVAVGGRSDLVRLLADATIASDRAQRDGIFWCRAATDRAGLEVSLSLMGELDQAIAGGELMVFYQPKLKLAADRISSVEALVRWQHPTRGFIGPDLFIPLAEQNDRIADLTLFVLTRVLADLADLRDQGHEISAAVNISAKLLSSDAFNQRVERLLGQAKIPAGALIFEVTESAAMSEPDAAIAALNHYRDLAIAVSMDDYGTGQSTLTYLRRLPLNELKIDRSFVQHAHRNQRDALLVRSTIDLAHEMGLTVVAEGIEETACLDFLRTVGCDLAQGYLISKPLPIEQLRPLLASHAEAGIAGSCARYAGADNRRD